MKTKTVYRQVKATIPECRISQEASKELASYLRFECDRIAKKAYVFARHAKRETIILEDIKLAIENKGT